MATCIVFDSTVNGLSTLRSSQGHTQSAWSAGQATFEGGAYSCPPGSHLLLTVQEVNEASGFSIERLASIGITPGSVVNATGFGFGVVLVPVLIAMAVGAIVRMISKA